MHVMIAKWAPPNERSVLASIVYAGKIIPLFSICNISICYIILYQQELHLVP